MWMLRTISKDYETAYRRYMWFLTQFNDQLGVGGWDNQIPEMAFNFLRDEGLNPQHTLLDIGCGKQRLGRYFVRYLESGNYFGIDISPAAIDTGKEILSEEGLLNKKSHLSVNNNLKFEEFNGMTFDYLLAFSVFTHLKRDQIQESFQNISKIMDDNTAFYFNYNENRPELKASAKSFEYEASELIEMAELSGLCVQSVESDIYKESLIDKPMLRATLM